MVDLSELEVFVRVAELGSFAKAAKALGLSNSSVSRKISSLEQRLGQALITRTTRKVNVTDFGQAYLVCCNRVLRELTQAEHLVHSFSAVPSGRLTIQASVATGQYFLAGILDEFMARFPEISIDLRLSNHRIDIIGTGVDVAIRIGKLSDSTLIAKRLGRLSFGLYASRQYLDQAKRPNRPEDLLTHKCLLMSDLPNPQIWTLKSETETVAVDIQSRLQIDDFATLLSLVERNAGISVFPEQIMRNKLNALERVLPDWSMRTVDIYALRPSHTVNVAKVSAFTEFLTKKTYCILKQ